jgi:hypothetical protein
MELFMREEIGSARVPNARAHMSHFRRCDRDTPYPAAAIVVTGCRGTTWRALWRTSSISWYLSALLGRYRGAGSAAYHPAMLLALILYGYSTGTYSSRRDLRLAGVFATSRPILTRITDTLCAFHKRFLKEIEALFVQVLCIAKEMNRDYMDVMPLGGTG